MLLFYKLLPWQSASLTEPVLYVMVSVGQSVQWVLLFTEYVSLGHWVQGENPVDE